MKILFLLACPLVGWWTVRDWELIGQIGMAIISATLGFLALCLYTILRAVMSWKKDRPRRDHGQWSVEIDDKVERTQVATEWVPIQGSPEDPQRNLSYSPDHQNLVDPDRWL